MGEEIEERPAHSCVFRFAASPEKQNKTPHYLMCQIGTVVMCQIGRDFPGRNIAFGFKI